MLYALKQHAEARGWTSEPGFRPKTIRWLLSFSRDGQFLGAQDMSGELKGSKGREFPRCPDLSQPEIKAGGAGCRHFLADSADVVALLTKDGDADEKLKAKHKYFVGLLQKASDADPDLAVVAESLCKETVLADIRTKLTEAKAGPTDQVSFAVLDTDKPILVERDSWHNWWRSFRVELTARKVGKSPSARNALSGRMRCLLSGEMVTPAQTHNKVTGLVDVGGLAMGDVLSPFKQPSTCSFGLEQAANSAMSEEMAEVYRATLNRLIADNGRKLAGAKVVYWYIGDIHTDEDPMPELFDGFDFGQANVGQPDSRKEPPNEERHRQQAESRAARLLEAIRSGDQNAKRLMDARYCALTLSANSGRVVVRDWIEGQFAALVRNIHAWFDDMAIVRRDGNALAPSPKFLAVLGATARDLRDVPPPHEAEMWRVAVRYRTIPQFTMAEALARVKVDIVQAVPMNHARMGLLKAYHKRKGDKNMQPYLNEEHPNPAYHCGRLMAVLAEVQREALGNVGAGVIQRYYAAASTTPALVLGRLVRTANYHFDKVGYYKKRIGLKDLLVGIWCPLKDTVPCILELEDQSYFALGYYQQLAQLATIDWAKYERQFTPLTNEEGELS